MCAEVINVTMENAAASISKLGWTIHQSSNLYTSKKTFLYK